MQSLIDRGSHVCIFVSLWSLCLHLCILLGPPSPSCPPSFKGVGQGAGTVQSFSQVVRDRTSVWGGKVSSRVGALSSCVGVSLSAWWRLKGVSLVLVVKEIHCRGQRLDRSVVMGHSGSGWLFLALASMCFLSLVRPSWSRKEHTSNFAVIISTSRYWFNYRHNANALSVYHSVKRLGIPDENIILMLPDDLACDPRNIYRAQMFNSHDHKINLYEDVEVDYRGYDVTIERFLQVLRGRHDKHTPRNQRMDSDGQSNILIYMTGHGGDEFLKFQDQVEISSQDFADAFSEMHEKNRYNEILFIVDTCQAGTLGNAVTAPNVLSVGSSLKNENSYSWSNDNDIGVTLIDRFTRAMMLFFENIKVRSDGSSDRTLQDLFNWLHRSDLRSHIGINQKNYHRKLSQIPVTDFFGSAIDIHVTSKGY